MIMAQGKFEDFESAEDVFRWWLSDLSKPEYLANKKQLSLL